MNEAKKRGGARPGSGPHRRRLQLDADTARELALLTKEWRESRNIPTLDEESVVRELVLQARTSHEPDFTVAMQAIQEVIHRSWQALIQQFLSNAGDSLLPLDSKLIGDLQEAVRESLEARSKGGN